MLDEVFTQLYVHMHVHVHACAHARVNILVGIVLYTFKSYGFMAEFWNTCTYMYRMLLRLTNTYNV